MQKIYPFKFLDAYQAEDKEIFFGRDSEIKTIYEMVFQTNLLVIYGASGTGKTSLLRCGLASKFQSHTWLPISIRRGANINESFEKAIQQAGGSIETPTDEWEWIEEDSTTPSQAKQALSALASQIKSLYFKQLRPIYLIFDQFEELYILGEKEEQVKFTHTIKELLSVVEQPVKILFSIREEYLGHLYEFEKVVPELMRKKLRVESMNLDKVSTVLEGINQLRNSQIHLEIGKEKELTQQIFDKIKGKDKSLTIQLPYLQVFLDKLYLQITKDQSRQQEATFTLAEVEKIKDIGDVLRDFLEDQAITIAQELNQTPETIWKILTPFVTLDGTKEPLGEAQILQKLPQIEGALVKKVIRTLTDRRILRFLEGSELYEIAHDSLAAAIDRRRTAEERALLEISRMVKEGLTAFQKTGGLLSAENLKYVQPFESKIHLSEAEKDFLAKSKAKVRANRLQRQVAITFLIMLTVFAVGFGIYAFWQKTEADRQENIARTNFAKAGKLINAFYFYEDRFALAFKSNKFYFIDKNGDKVEKLGEWDKAEMFDWQTGFAKVKGEDSLDYLLDTLGNTYQVAYKIADLSPEIEALDLTGTQLDGFPTKILAHTQLEVLILNGEYNRKNNLKTLPPEIVQLKNLKYLFLEMCQLDSLPIQIKDLKNLKVLNLGLNKFATLPIQITKLESLVVLGFRENKITILPSQIEDLKSLISLDLGNNQLSSLPTQIERLKSLKKLYLSYNKFKDLPTQIEKFDSLTTLDLNNNKLITLPIQIGKLKNLTHLHLTSNQLSTLPTQIEKLEKLTHLDLGENQLVNLPNQIRGLKKLIYLTLSRNLLIDLPPQIGELKDLKMLLAASNQLHSLPIQISELKNLTSLGLSGNQLRSLPIQISELKSLTILSLINNPIPPEEQKKIRKLLPNCKVLLSP